MTAAELGHPMVCADRWPARVVLHDGTVHDQARAVLTVADPDRPPLFIVWSGEIVDGLPAVVVDLEWIPAASTVAVDGTGVWTVATPRGDILVAAAPGARCCGGTFAHWQPWSPYRMTTMPRDLRRPT